MEQKKSNEEWIAEYNKAIDQGFDVPSSWLRSLLTTRDAERDEAYKQGLKDGAVNPGERRRIIEQLRAEVNDEAVEAARREEREREAYIWFDSWYAYYISNSMIGSTDFGKWASERLQALGAVEPRLLSDSVQIFSDIGNLLSKYDHKTFESGHSVLHEVNNYIIKALDPKDPLPTITK